MRSLDSGNFDNELVVQYVVSYMTCGICESQYRLEDVHIIDEDDDVWAMVVECARCGAEGLVLAVASPLDDDEEIAGEPFVASWWDSGLAPLVEKDVDEWRDFLADFHGDMYDLLQAGE